MFKWFSNIYKKKGKKILDLSDIDIIVTPKLTIDLTDHIDSIEINKDEDMNTVFDSDKAIMNIKEINVSTIKINGLDVTDDILEIALKNRELF